MAQSPLASHMTSMDKAQNCHMKGKGKKRTRNTEQRSCAVTSAHAAHTVRCRGGKPGSKHTLHPRVSVCDRALRGQEELRPHVGSACLQGLVKGPSISTPDILFKKDKKESRLQT